MLFVNLANKWSRSFFKFFSIENFNFQFNQFHFSTVYTTLYFQINLWFKRTNLFSTETAIHICRLLSRVAIVFKSTHTNKIQNRIKIKVVHARVNKGYNNRSENIKYPQGELHLRNDRTVSLACARNRISLSTINNYAAIGAAIAHARTIASARWPRIN